MTSYLNQFTKTDHLHLLSYEQMTHIHTQALNRKQKGFYFMYDCLVETKPIEQHVNSHDIYLVGHNQLDEKIKIFANFENQSIVEKLKSCASLHELLFGIGIYVYSKDTDQINVILETKQGEQYRQINIPAQTNGDEAFVSISDFNWDSPDEQLVKLSFQSDTPHAIANVTIVFFTHDECEIPEMTIDSDIDFQSSHYRNMVEKSLMSIGNATRLKRAIDKAKRGEEVTIAYIGGSITQGAAALPHKNCYAYQSYLRLKDMFGQDGGDHIHFIKAGVGGTPSELGMIRYERDILKAGKAHPDIIIVEFAVNDADDETNGISYESLVLRALQEPNMPAVVLLFSVFFNDWNLQDRLAPIGLHYHLPMVSIKDAVVDQFYLTKDNGHVISKRQFFYDIYHPKNAGHTIMADCLAYLFNQVDSTSYPVEDISFDKPAVYGTDFKCIKLIDRINIPDLVKISRGGFNEIDNVLQEVELDINEHTTPQFPYNWSHTALSGDQSFIMELKCKKLLLVFKDSGDGQFGKVDVLINHQHFKQLDAHEVKWNHCHAILLINEQQSQNYEIEIKMSEGYSKHLFTILAFGYVE